MGRDDKNQLELSIYLADDDKDDRDLFKSALQEIYPYIQLSLFSTGKELITMLTSIEQKPDLIFLDLYMPIIDGEACLDHIRKDLIYKDIPVIIYSSEFDLDRIEDLFQLGASGYLKKPFSYQDLLTSLKKMILPFELNANDAYFKRQIVA